MILDLPVYVPVLFLSTVFLTVGILFYTVRQASLLNSVPGKLLVSTVLLWMLATALLALAGFYRVIETTPPRVFVFGALPSLVLIAMFFVFFRRQFVDKLPLKTLTLLHVIRVPVEIVLLLLERNGLVSPYMTFEGWNFDILSGLSAPVVAWLAFRGAEVNRPLLLVWNLAALALLFAIISIAFLSFPTPIQQLSPEQPNVAVTYFPYIWLPAVIVPIVLCAHLTAITRLLGSRNWKKE